MKRQVVQCSGCQTHFTTSVGHAKCRDCRRPSRARNLVDCHNCGTSPKVCRLAHLESRKCCPDCAHTIPPATINSPLLEVRP